jgi:hypothetical protein
MSDVMSIEEAVASFLTTVSKLDSTMTKLNLGKKKSLVYKLLI